MKGKFVTFEGCEGVGKSTQLKQLKEYLDKTGQPAIFTREPGGNKISEQIRSVILNPENTEMNAMCEALLYAASRAQLVDEVIKPALDRGELVICDRFLDSSIAYQGGARGLGIENVLEINRHAIQGCMPDLTVFWICRRNIRSEAVRNRPSFTTDSRTKQWIFTSRFTRAILRTPRCRRAG